MFKIGLMFRYGTQQEKNTACLMSLKDAKGLEDLDVLSLDWRYKYTEQEGQALFKDINPTHVNFCADEFCKNLYNKPLKEIDAATKTEYQKRTGRSLEEDAKNYYTFSHDQTLEQTVNDYLSKVDAIYVPGISFDLEKEYCLDDPKKPGPDHRREKFERLMVQKAIERGIPVLGICAGSWLVATCFKGSKTKAFEHKHELDTHFLNVHYQAGKVIIDDKQIETIRNAVPYTLPKPDQDLNGPVDGTLIEGIRVPLHNVTIAPGTLLYDIVKNGAEWEAVKNENGEYTKFIRKKAVSITNNNNEENSNGVNEGPITIGGTSTHWRAVVAQEDNTDRIDDDNLLVISAREPETFSIEGFETRFGVPVMGIQFHPEYRIPVFKTNSKIIPDLGFPENKRILIAFAEAGKAYALKKNHLKNMHELKLFKDVAKEQAADLNQNNEQNPPNIKK